MKNSVSVLLVFLSFVFSFSSCSDEVVDPFDPVAQAATDEALIKEYMAKDTMAAKVTPQRTNSGLYYVPLQASTGQKVQAGDKVKVHYIGRFLNGSKFDSSYDKNSPLIFTIGEGKVIKGWDEALPYMKAGEQARFYIPSAMAYGQAGSTNIPGNAVLVFDIQVIQIF